MMKKRRFLPLAVLLYGLLLGSCASNTSPDLTGEQTVLATFELADELEESLFSYILEPWYPRNIDSLYGGYISAFDHDWTLSAGSQEKALVQQARHMWTCAHIYENYPEKKAFLDYASHGFRFLQGSMWDQEYGGFYAYSNQDGSPVAERINEKRAYGQAFAIYGLAQYYRVSHDQEALELAKRTFVWMEEHAYDPLHGGYFEHLWRDGTPILALDSLKVVLGDDPATGMKDYNSSIHVMEAFTELYRAWPDPLVRERLEEVFLLIRDTFVHPDGYLQLYFYPDWELVPAEIMEKRSPSNHWFTQHITYGHDVETAFLLLETAHILGREEDEKTRHAAKQLVDHSLASGWDSVAGGFFDAGKELDGEIAIINSQKSWWGLVEGMNALLMMHQLYPDDPLDYGLKFQQSWKHIDNYLIDKEHGGWYGAALDSSPENKTAGKSHIWKTTYHNARAMVNCIKMLHPKKPNIVFILADDMGHSDPGCYGAEILQTPHIDALATKGLRFSNFYNTGRCWPTRTSLLSGYYPHQVLSDPILGVDYQSSRVQPVNSTWLPAVLKAHGYSTYHSGKWHIVRKVPVHSEISHTEVGFDHSFHTEDGRHLRPRHLWEDGNEIALPEGGSGYDASVAIVDHAIGYLEEHKQKRGNEPFFEYIAFIAPHFPLQAMQEDIDMYREKFMVGWDEIRRLRTENRKELGFDIHQLNALEPERYAPWNLSPEEMVRQIDPAETGRAIPWSDLSREQQEFQAVKMAIHAAMVTRMDREIGRYMAALKDLGYLENTIVFFCSDNGASTEMMNRADKHTIASVPGSADSYICLGPGWSSAANTPFRLHKTWVHEGGIATPMVVHWPDGIKDAGSFRSMPAHIIDMAPTMLELAGACPSDLKGRAEAPGISLLPFLAEDVESERPPLFFHHEKKKALRHGDWKITTIEEDGAWELYDLSRDRGECNDLASEHPEKLKELVSLWEAQREKIIQQTGGSTN